MQLRNFRFSNPSKWPFFYGWFIAFMATIGLFVSIPGQTMAVSAFTDSLLQALDLTRNELSFAYMIGTLCSALLLKKSGVWYDKYGAKIVMFGATFIMAITMLGMAKILPMARGLVAITGHLTSLKIWILILLSFLFFLARLNGQGIMSMVARNMLMKWFFKKRGLANGISSMVANAVFAMATVGLALLVVRYNWDGAYELLAVVLLLSSFIFLGTYEEKPEDFGLLPDGEKIEENNDNKIEQKTIRDFSYSEAIKTRAFWSVTMVTAFFGFFVTGFTFHIFSIFRDASIPWSIGKGVFIYSAILSTMLSFGGSVISDHIKIKYLVLLATVGGALCGIGLGFLEHMWSFYLLTLGYGTIGGLFGVLLAVAYPRYFGKKHLGAIAGRNMSLIIFLSAISPFMFSITKSFTGSYHLMATILSCAATFIFIFTLTVNEPQ